MSMQHQKETWDLPSAGSILLAKDGKDVRPSIVVSSYAWKDGLSFVSVILGTTEFPNYHSSELFTITKSLPKDVWAASGLCFNTGFNLRKQYNLSYDTGNFVLPIRPKFGFAPVLGIVHPSIIGSLKEALERVG